ncbi:unnamed protein product [Prorocentrum cordatum]|uniref:G domain-containing protein n=1 Tax=Prorocentrum cordatum TaxID=2364126 RepID=A0ABN9VKX0_9DINO|nr:unnamed protein product [Polarella glacialis]|mmetsp:Transcript_35774/g.95882  ORF Transcript_35774/g.95882 Transcript_35774/m.95882 type:complete len:367 (+) Transcript_35774:79-1179(+)
MPGDAGEGREKLPPLVFFRITVLGSSNSGKTSLINSYVNGVCPARYTKTDKVVLYYRKVEIEDDGEVEDVRKAVLVEIEDTPGSERGSDEAESGNQRVGPGAPKIQKGSRVVLEKDKDKLREMMKNNAKFEQMMRKGLERMMGRDHIVRDVLPDGTFGLPSHDGSDGGVWHFPKDAVSLKISLDMPIDKYLHLDIKDLRKVDAKMTAKELSKFKEDLQRPFSAGERPVKHPDEDRTITKQRMGYFLCFDLSDPESDSLREAMNLYKMLLDSDKDARKIMPKVWLIGCKQDRSSDATVIRRNKQSAMKFANDREIPFAATSARDHKGVREAFGDMIRAISSCEILWRMEEADDGGDDKDEESGCQLQ